MGLWLAGNQYWFSFGNTMMQVEAYGHAERAESADFDDDFDGGQERPDAQTQALVSKYQ